MSYRRRPEPDWRRLQLQTLEMNMEFDMKKGSPFRVNVYPKIWLWIGIGASAICLIFKMILHPDPALIAAGLACLALGVFLGRLYANVLLKKVTSKSQYMGCRRPAAVVWVLIIICTLLSRAAFSWAFLLCFLMIGYSAGFFWFYLPHYIEISNQIVESQNRKPD